MSCSVFSVADHALASASKGFTKGLAHMPCALTIWSSSSACASSDPPSTYVPVSLYGTHRNSCPSHSLVIFLSVCASEYSLDALAPMFSSCSSRSSAPHSRRSDAVGGCSGSYAPFSKTAKIFSQCRGCNAGLATSLSRGTYLRNASISSRVRITTWSSLRSFSILYAAVYASSTPLVMASSSSVSHALDIQLRESARKRNSASHESCFAEYSFTARSSEENAPTAVPKSFWYRLYRSHFAPCASSVARTTASACTTSAGSLSRSMYIPVFSDVCSRNRASSTSATPVLSAFIISAFLLSTCSPAERIASKNPLRASFRSSRRTWSAAGIFISYSTSMPNMSSTVACSATYDAFAAACFWCCSTRDMNPSRSSGRGASVLMRFVKFVPALIASSRAFTSRSAFMLSSMPCTVPTSSVRRGLPSTKTHPAVAEVFMRSRSWPQPRCTSMSARNVATVLGAFSYSSRFQDAPNACIGLKSSYVLTYSRASAKEEAIFASSDARMESHVASARRTAIGPRPSYARVGARRGDTFPVRVSDSDAPDASRCVASFGSGETPSTISRGSSPFDDVNVSCPSRDRAAASSRGWNARAKATRGAAPTARATPSSTVPFTVASTVLSSGSNAVTSPRSKATHALSAPFDFGSGRSTTSSSFRRLALAIATSASVSM